MPPDFVETVESAAEWLIEQARSQNVHMKSTVSFFKESVSCGERVIIMLLMLSAAPMQMFQGIGLAVYYWSRWR